MTPPETAFGLNHFLAATDAIGVTLFVILIAMSVASWAVIFNKLRHQLKAENRTNAESRIEEAALHSHDLLPTGQRQIEDESDLLTRCLQQALDDESERLESGQTLLASIASSAPFVGLFGTVWGIYHALIQIGQTGQSSLEQVAGPVGEALIMTALGLAVAIPAALAYNAFSRSARKQMSQLERFAHRVYLARAASLKGA
ncbi:MAG: hypothetical protein RL133_1723 [Pseudomonadota bacterium]|jgi:biopolymer transport protein ExbB